MDLYSPRKLMFKVWSKEERLLLRMDALPCVRGEIKKKDHIFLQFTGVFDKQQEELYEMDIVFRGKGADKFIVRWNVKHTGWCITDLDNEIPIEELTQDIGANLRRLCSYFESTLNEKY
jgi:hypothetical protein